jgi:hypothetical protein
VAIPIPLRAGAKKATECQALHLKDSSSRSENNFQIVNVGCYGETDFALY